MGKRYISLNENDLNRIVETSLMTILMEAYDSADDEEWGEEEDYDVDVHDAAVYDDEDEF